MGRACHPPAPAAPPALPYPGLASLLRGLALLGSALATARIHALTPTQHLLQVWITSSENDVTLLQKGSLGEGWKTSTFPLLPELGWARPPAPTAAHAPAPTEKPYAYILGPGLLLAGWSCCWSQSWHLNVNSVLFTVRKPESSGPPWAPASNRQQHTAFLGLQLLAPGEHLVWGGGSLFFFFSATIKKLFLSIVLKCILKTCKSILHQIKDEWVRRKRKGRKTDGPKCLNLVCTFVSFQEFISSCEVLSWIKSRLHSYNHEVYPGHHCWGGEGREVSISVSLHLASLTNRLLCGTSKYQSTLFQFEEDSCHT